MVGQKRPFSQAARSQTKKLRSSQNDQFRSQDIWKNLDRVRKLNDKADATLKSSYLFMPVVTEGAISECVPCVQALHEYIDSEKLQLHKIKRDYGFIVLSNFSLLDCCLVLTVILALKNKRWIAANSGEYFNIPSNVALSGTFYLPGGSICSRVDGSQYMVKIKTSELELVAGFEEFLVDVPSGVNLTPFMDGLSMLFAQTKFGNSRRAVSRFRKRFKDVQESLGLSLHNSPFTKKLLLDMTMVSKENVPLLEASKKNLQTYAKDLILHNIQAAPSDKASTQVGGNQSQATSTIESGDVSKRAPSRQQAMPVDKHSASVERHNSSNSTAVNNNHGKFSGNGSFMTAQQIKDHCMATIKASMDVMKTKSPYQIFRLYVKCPRQYYIDIIYQQLNDLRSQTNCNIVVLNLNNLHESDPWFDSLDVSPFTQSVQRPHPSTVRVISVGGIGEHIAKALEAISKILST